MGRDERMIGALDWANVGRVFDAFQVRWQGKQTRVDILGAFLIKDFPPGQAACKALRKRTGSSRAC